MSSFKGTSRLILDGTYTQALDRTTPSEKPAFAHDQVWTSGTGDLQANRFFHDSKAISAIDNLDLSGSLADAYGNTLTMTAIKELTIKNTSTTSGEDLHIAGTWFLNNVLTGWVDDAVLFVLERGGVLTWRAPYGGYSITGGTEDIVSLTPAAGTPTYEIWILGVE